MDRNLDWDGLFNARDLGGLRTDGGQTRWRTATAAVVETVAGLDPAGYLRSAGVGAEDVAALRARLLTSSAITAGAPE